MAGFAQYLQQTQARPQPSAPSHGSALLALMTAALRARQQPPMPQGPVMMPGPMPQDEYSRGYQAGLELLRRQGR